MNNQEYEDILQTFKRQLELTKELIKTADFKFDAIKNNDTDSLMDLTNKEEQFAREIIQLEKKRDVYIKKLEKEKNEKITHISQVIGELSLDMSVSLALLAEELKYNLEILQEKNNINQDMIVFVLEQIEIANNLIRGDRVPNTYKNTKFNKKTYSNIEQDSYFDIKY